MSTTRVKVSREEMLAVLGKRTSPPGSHQTRGGWEPKNCWHCGQPVPRDNGVFCRPAIGEPYSRHHDCPDRPREERSDGDD